MRSWARAMASGKSSRKQLHRGKAVSAARSRKKLEASSSISNFERPRGKSPGWLPERQSALAIQWLPPCSIKMRLESLADCIPC